MGVEICNELEEALRGYKCSLKNIKILSKILIVTLQDVHENEPNNIVHFERMEKRVNVR